MGSDEGLSLCGRIKVQHIHRSSENLFVFFFFFSLIISKQPAEDFGIR